MAKDIHVLGRRLRGGGHAEIGIFGKQPSQVGRQWRGRRTCGKKKFPARYRNTCWSLISPENGVKVGASYKPGEKKVEATETFISKTGEELDLRVGDFNESLGWYDAITTEMFAKS